MYYPELEKGGYSPRLALFCAYLSSWVYGPKRGASAAECDDFMTERFKQRYPDTDFEITYFDNNNSQGAVVEMESFSIAVFRGTDGSADWIKNFDIHTVDTAMGEVHKGFYNALLDIWQPMFTKLSKGPLLMGLCGHSLGGAMATGAAYILHEERGRFGACYTYGQPKFGDKHFAQVMKYAGRHRMFRAVHNNDIVPKMPAFLELNSWHIPVPQLWRHTGQEKYIDDDGELVGKLPWIKRCMDSWEGRIQDIGVKGTDGVSDHMRQHYVWAHERAIGLPESCIRCGSTVDLYVDEQHCNHCGWDSDEDEIGIAVLPEPESVDNDEYLEDEGIA